MLERNDHTVRYQRRAPARTEELRRIRQAVESEALRFGFDAETAYRLALAVDEACANIIEHAYGERSAGWFSVEITTAPGRFIVTLVDTGRRFQPEPLPPLDVTNRVREHQDGGLGLHIINRVMDDVHYGLTPNSENRLQMVKYLDTSGRAS